MIEVLIKQEVSEIFQIPKRTIDYLVLTKQIPFFRVGKRSVQFEAGRLREWTREQECVELKYNKEKA